MAYYDSFVAINESPRDSYKNLFQEVVNQSFVNAPTYYEDVAEERVSGSLEFIPVDVRVNNLIDAKTGERVNDDFKKLIFQDNTYMPRIGTRYKFNDNIWIVYSTDNIKTDTASVYVRRCNNTINTQDKYGNIHEEPCYIDYSLTETQIFKEYSIDIPRARIVITCQLNNYTKDIDVNNRFIFSDDAYKVRTRDKFDRRNTFNSKSISLLKIQMDYDNVSETDNLELGIANYRKYEYTIKTAKTINNKIGSKGTLKSKVFLNGKEESFFVSFESTNENIATIDKNTGKYLLKNVGNCNFICKLLDNSSISATTNVEVINIPIKDINENIITPNITYIKMNAQQEYNVNEYVNNIMTDTIFKIDTYNASKNAYKIIKDTNKFTITTLRTSKIPLRVICTNLKDNTVVEIIIELGGLF